MIVTRANRTNDPGLVDRSFRGAPGDESPDRWWDKLNRVIFPFMGPAQVGPYETEARPSLVAAACPLCGAPMNSHEIDRSGPRTQLYCPTPVDV